MRSSKMASVITLLMLTLIACSDGPQKPATSAILQILTDTSNNFRAKSDRNRLNHYNAICKEIGLNKLSNGADSLEIRAWRQFSVFGMATDEEIYSIKFADSVVRLTFYRVYCKRENVDNENERQWNPFTNAKVEEFYAISKTFPASIVDRLQLQDIWSLQSLSALAIPDSIGFLDGTTNSIEIATATQYKLISYHVANAFYEKTKLEEINQFILAHDQLIRLFRSNKVYHEVY